MSTEIYFRNLKECIYTDFAWNLFGTQHDKVIQEGLYFVKIKDNKYICIEELLSNKKKKKI